MISIRSRSTRMVAAGVLSAGLLAGGSVAGAATASAEAPAGHVVATASMTAASISIKASPTSVTSGGKVTFTGTASGLKSGATVMLQRDVNGTWQTVTKSGMNVQTTVTSSGSYTLHANPTTMGLQHYRVVSGSVHSLTASVNVT